MKRLNRSDEKHRTTRDEDIEHVLRELRENRWSQEMEITDYRSAAPKAHTHFHYTCTHPHTHPHTHCA